MRISPVNNNQNSFQAVNQRYYQWAKRELTEKSQTLGREIS